VKACLDFLSVRVGRCSSYQERKKEEQKMSKARQLIWAVGISLTLLLSHTATAQTTAFTYQGKLTDSGNLANGQYDFQFKLFDAVSGGAQQGITLTVNSVTVSNGIFTVQLDFSICTSCFDGSARFLEIAVKLTSGGSFTTLTPRQQITATPYAMKTMNLTFNGAFNDGAGTAFTASNTFAGDSAGVNTTPSGTLNDSTGKFNSFYGAGAGQANITGTLNAFFCPSAGSRNITGTNNAFFGSFAGFNTFSGFNAYFGHAAGFRNTSGTRNTFIGDFADFNISNPSGNDNTLLGFSTQVSSPISNATAIGAFATVTQSNSLVLGAISGINDGISVNVGIGITAPTSKLHVSGAGIIRARINSDSNAGVGLSINEQSRWSLATATGGNFQIYNDATSQNAFWIDGTNNNVGIGTTSPARLLHVAGRARIGSLPLEASTGSVCGNASGDLLQCGASSLRFKTNVQPFRSGLNLIRQLRPISFDWKKGGTHDIGLAAEEVAEVAPFFTFTDAQGRVSGVKYERLNMVLLNGIKELAAENGVLKAKVRQLSEQQRTQQSVQQAQFQRQQQQIEALTKLVCSTHLRGAGCKSRRLRLK
jgi:hypothetical protein